MSQVAHQAKDYPGFGSIKQLGVFLLPLGGKLVHHRITPSITFTGVFLYTWVERDTVSVKCLIQEHNAVSPAELKSRPLDPETSTLTMGPLRLQLL